MDIDEILNKHIHLNSVNIAIEGQYKRAIKEIVKETLRMAAEDAEGYISNYSHNGEQYFDVEVDKDSITNVIKKIKF